MKFTKKCDHQQNKNRSPLLWRIASRSGQRQHTAGTPRGALPPWLAWGRPRGSTAALAAQCLNANGVGLTAPTTWAFPRNPFPSHAAPAATGPRHPPYPPRPPHLLRPLARFPQQRLIVLVLCPQPGQLRPGGGQLLGQQRQVGLGAGRKGRPGLRCHAQTACTVCLPWAGSVRALAR